MLYPVSRHSILNLAAVCAVFGQLSYLTGSGSWSRAAPLLALGLAIGLLVATRDSSLRMLRLRVWVTLCLPICALVWILTYFGDCHRGDLIWGLESGG